MNVLLDRCPRCGGEFHCGVNDAEPCACSTPKLGDALRAELRERYIGCLCIACLRALAAETPDAALSTQRPGTYM